MFTDVGFHLNSGFTNIMCTPIFPLPTILIQPLEHVLHGLPIPYISFIAKSYLYYIFYKLYLKRHRRWISSVSLVEHNSVPAILTNKIGLSFSFFLEQTK